MKTAKPVTAKTTSFYKRAVEVIVALNEKIVAGEDEESDPLWGELAQLRKQVEEDQSEVIGRLSYSLAVQEKEIEIDEATPGSQAHWR